MKLYYFPIAPNPTKILIFLREKGIDIELELVDLRKGEQRGEAHLARNPAGVLPVLELDSGEFLTESLPIMEYLEELYPAPPMIGRDALERARIRSLERMAEQGVMSSVGRIVHATNSPIGLPPNPAIAEAERARLPGALGRLDEHIGQGPFVAGDSPSIADCTLYASLLFGALFGVEVPEEYGNLRRWFERFGARPSAQIELPA